MKLTKSSLSQLIKCKSLKCAFRNKRKAQIQPCGDVYSSIYGYFNLEDDYDENLHNKKDSRFDIISVEEYMSKYFNGDKLSSYEDSPITYVHKNMEKFNRVIADLEAKLAESEKKAYSRGHSQRDIANEIKLNALREDVANKEKRIVELKKQLAENEKEIEELKLKLDIRAISLQNFNIERMQAHQDKISFAVEQLEKVKENIHYLLSFDYNLLSKVNEQFDNQIKQAKEMK